MALLDKSIFIRPRQINKFSASVVFSFQLFVLFKNFNMKSVFRQRMEAESVILNGIIHDHALMPAPS